MKTRALLCVACTLVAGCGGKTGMHGPPRAEPDAGLDAGQDAGLDSGLDAGEDAEAHAEGGPPDAEPDAPCECASDLDCDDANACTGDFCQDCQCFSGVWTTCNDGVDCTIDDCQPEDGCHNIPDHTLCAQTELCDPVNGCVAIPCADATDCDDAVFCNGVESCPAGLCLQGPVPTCDDGVSCTGDRCDALADSCVGDPIDSLCDDQVFCNGVETCGLGGCLDGQPPPCDDGLDCTSDRCDGTLDECAHDRPDRDGDGFGDAACDDGPDCNDDDPTVHPGALEVCDGIDQNCIDGVDEGVLSECGDCRNCSIVDFPRDQLWTDDPAASDGVTVDPDGSLVLDSSSIEIYFAWIANTGEGTVTKLDTRTGAEVGRYASVTDFTSNEAPDPLVPCRPEGGNEGNCPSRTAVDLRGNVFVANRAFEQMGTVTKIANFEEDCIDRDGDGTIETSRDVDGNGTISLGDAQEYLGKDDECILWTVETGNDSVPRSIAIDAEGDVWVGLFNRGRFLELDPDDGGELQRVNMDIAPYGAAIGSNGVLWAADSCCGQGRIQSVDTAAGEAGDVVDVETNVGCIGNYGIAIDADNRVWLGGFPCEAAFRYNPESDSWFTVNLVGQGLGRGIAAGADGRIWMGVSTSAEWGQLGRVVSFRAADGGGVRTYDLPEGVGTVGVGLDSAENVWAVNFDTSSASRIDTETGAIDEFPVGPSPYTYSDFTGFALRTFTAPSGYHREIVEGCAGGPTSWERITWDAVLPAGTRVEISVRTAATPEELGAQSFVGPWTDSPADLTQAPGPVGTDRYLEIEIRLYSDDGVGSPELQGLHVQASCS